MHDRKIKFEDGEAYEQMMGVWSQLVGFKFLQWLSPSIEQRWIDVGCGNGAFTEQIIKNCKTKKTQTKAVRKTHGKMGGRWEVDDW